jgi:hypothetical protein
VQEAHEVVILRLPLIKYERPLAVPFHWEDEVRKGVVVCSERLRQLKIHRETGTERETEEERPRSRGFATIHITKPKLVVIHGYSH